MTDRRPLTLRTDTAPAKLQEMPNGDLLPTDTLGNALQLVLQGLVTTNNAGITAADTILQALGKLQAQANNKVDKVAGMGLSSNNFTNEERVKLSNVADAATKNAADASLRDRATHTGMQSIDTITDLQTQLNTKTNKNDSLTVRSGVKGTQAWMASLGYSTDGGNSRWAVTLNQTDGKHLELADSNLKCNTRGFNE